MLIPLAIVILVNLGSLLFFILAVIFLIRWSIRYTRAIGDDALQHTLRLRILYLVLFLLLVSLVTAALNIVAGTT